MSDTPRVKLTKRVVRGLSLMKAAVGADPQAILLGHDNPMSGPEKAEMADYEAAVRWIEYQQAKGGGA